MCSILFQTSISLSCPLPSKRSLEQRLVLSCLVPPFNLPSQSTAAGGVLCKSVCVIPVFYVWWIFVSKHHTTGSSSRLLECCQWICVSETFTTFCTSSSSLISFLRTCAWSSSSSLPSLFSLLLVEVFFDSWKWTQRASEQYAECIKPNDQQRPDNDDDEDDGKTTIIGTLEHLNQTRSHPHLRDRGHAFSCLSACEHACKQGPDCLLLVDG